MNLRREDYILSLRPKPYDTRFVYDNGKEYTTLHTLPTYIDSDIFDNYDKSKFGPQEGSLKDGDTVTLLKKFTHFGNTLWIVRTTNNLLTCIDESGLRAA